MNTAHLKNDPSWPTLIVTALDSMDRLPSWGALESPERAAQSPLPP
jgi:hypothetical protein